ncbi:MAG: nucleotide exchange factor GrpE [bacterium]
MFSNQNEEEQDSEQDNEQPAEDPEASTNDPETDSEDEDEMIEISREEYEQIKQERDELEEKYLRRTADLDNLRKRHRKEKEEYEKYSNVELLKDIFEVADNFDRALDSMGIESDDVQQGVKMIRDQLFEVIEKHNVEQIEAEEEPFDPHKHEAMMMEEREDVDEKTVVDVFEKGYELYDRVIRPASVKVAKPAENSRDDQNEKNQAENESETVEVEVE